MVARIFPEIFLEKLWTTLTVNAEVLLQFVLLAQTRTLSVHVETTTFLEMSPI